MTWKTLVTLCWGLLYSSPIGENPEIVMKLSPKSRGFDDSSGRPTARFRLPALVSCTEPAATRLKAKRAWLMRFAEKV